MKSTVDEFHRITDSKHSIRNISVIGDSGYGKSTLTNYIVAAATGDVWIEDTPLQDNNGECRLFSLTLMSFDNSLYGKTNNDSLKKYKGERQDNKYLVNLIDTPGHKDFSSEIPAAIRTTDGALVIVDGVEGVSAHTETLLRQAMAERIHPVLTINKLDRFFLDPQMDGEEAYQMCSAVIEKTNAILANHDDHSNFLDDFLVHPEKGTVAFSAGVHGWAFTLTYFAKMYASKFGVDESTMMEKLWGENFFDPQTRRWTNHHTGSSTCKRGFHQFCYEPIKQIIGHCMGHKKEYLWPMLSKLGVAINYEDMGLTGMGLVNCVMKSWLPSSTALLEMAIFHLPSPATAQKYRVKNLYDGNLHDKYATAIRNCDPDGPFILYVSRAIPTAVPGNGRFFVLGRVLSGWVSTGMNIEIMDMKNCDKDVSVKSVGGTVNWRGTEDLSCGNIVPMIGLELFITKEAILIDQKEEVEAHPIIGGMKRMILSIILCCSP